MSEKHARAYVAQGGQQQLLVIDARTLAKGSPVTDLPVSGDLVLDEATDCLYVPTDFGDAQQQQEIVELEINPSGQQVRRRVRIDAQNSIQAATAVDGNHVYVATFGERPGLDPGQKVTVIDRGTFKVVNEVPVEAGMIVGMSVHRARCTLFALTSGDVQLIDTRDLRVRARLPLPGGRSEGTIVADQASAEVYLGQTGSNSVFYSGAGR